MLFYLYFIILSLCYFTFIISILCYFTCMLFYLHNYYTSIILNLIREVVSLEIIRVNAFSVHGNQQLARKLGQININLGNSFMDGLEAKHMKNNNGSRFLECSALSWTSHNVMHFLGLHNTDAHLPSPPNISLNLFVDYEFNNNYLQIINSMGF